ncbi:MAG TPA: hypothetical protein VGM56_10160, partial [Byssovorax sp.]
VAVAIGLLFAAALPACRKTPIDDAVAASASASAHRRREARGRRARGPRPTRAPAIAGAAPLVAPSLPALDAQQKAPEAKAAKAAAGSCGVTKLGAATVALDCAPDAAPLAGAMTPVVAFAALKGDDALLPSVVDHRAEGAESAVRDAGAQPFGSAFALEAAIDHAVARWTGAPGAASALWIWERYHEPSLSKALAANVGQPARAEGAWPFDEATAKAWLACKPGGPCHASDAATKPGDPARETDDVRIEDVGAFDSALFRAKIAAGEDVIVALRVGPALSIAGAEGARYVSHYEADPAAGTLSVVLSGYARAASATYFLARASLGARFGDKGYAWLHEATLTANAAHAYAVEAEPADAKARKRPGHHDGTKHCKAGYLPDAVTGACAGECADRGPRAADVCANATDCPKGLVNLTGACAPAAPVTQSGKGATDVRFFCGAAGCFYRVAKGKFGCEKDACTFSCPAPTFRAMTTEKAGFTCWQ